jgi:hypothetical protein
MELIIIWIQASSSSFGLLLMKRTMAASLRHFFKAFSPPQINFRQNLDNSPYFAANYAL